MAGSEGNPRGIICSDDAAGVSFFQNFRFVGIETGRKSVYLYRERIPCRNPYPESRVWSETFYSHLTKARFQT